MPSGTDHLKTSSSVFEFTSQFSLKSISSGNYTVQYGFDNGIDIAGDIMEFDSFANNWQMEWAYAQILTHPASRAST